MFGEVAMRCKAMLTDAFLFGCPEQRRRFYIIGANPNSPLYSTLGLDGATVGDLIDKAFDKVVRLMMMCERVPPCVTSILESDDALSVHAELTRRIAEGTKTSEYNVGQSISAHANSGTRWGDLSSIPANARASDWFRTLAPSHKNALAFSFGENNDALMRDVGQSLGRIRVSTTPLFGMWNNAIHCSPCMMPGQAMWLTTSGACPRLLLGRECMRTLCNMPVHR